MVCDELQLALLHKFTTIQWSHPVLGYSLLGVSITDSISISVNGLFRLYMSAESILVDCMHPEIHPSCLDYKVCWILAVRSNS